MSQDSTSIRVERHAGVATIVLNRPQVLNALNRATRQGLLEAFEGLSHDRKTQAVVVTGSGRGFCAGADLGDRGAQHDAERVLIDEYIPLIRTIRGFPLPVVVAVNGVAAGAGVSLALSGDLVIAADSARFVPAFGRIALVPDSGLTRVLVRALGRHRAASYLLLGTPMTAAEAAAVGLVHSTVPLGQLERTAARIARQLAAGSTYAIGLTKRLINEAEDAALEASMAAEARLQKSAALTRDHADAVSAFLAARSTHAAGDG